MTASTVILETKECKEHKKIILNLEDANILTKYKYLSIDDVRNNEKKASTGTPFIESDLWENAFLSTAVLFTQQKYRQKRLKKLKTVTESKSYSKPATMMFAREPLNDKHKEYAKHIMSNQWLELNFNDHDFIRNIFKAHRLGLLGGIIEATQRLATANLLYHAVKFFQDPDQETSIGLHSFLEKGPYDPASINYSLPNNVSLFKKLAQRNSKNLSTSSSHFYFAIDLPITHVAILLSILLFQKPPNLENYIDIYKKFFSQQLYKFDIEKTETVAHCETLHLPESENYLKTAFTRILKIIFPETTFYVQKKKIIGDKFSDKKSEMLFNTYRLFAALLTTQEQIPNLVMSTEFDPTDIMSPILSFILPTIPAYNLLHVTMHGKDTTHPVFLVGRLSPHNLLHYYMHEDYLRPVELVHPDIPHEETPHNYLADPFMLTWHDLYHLWRNGANMHKDLCRHLIKEFQLSKNIVLNKLIWSWVDNDFNAHQVRLAEKNNELIKHKRIHLISDRILGDDFFKFLDQYDVNLLFIINMIEKADLWKGFLGSSPEEFFPKESFTTNIWLESNIEYRFIGKEKVFDHDFTQFQNILKTMRDIIEKNPLKEKVPASSIYYILLYRFRNLSISHLIHKIVNLNINTFFGWNINSGIFLKLNNDQKLLIEKSDNIQELYLKICEVFLTYCIDKNIILNSELLNEIYWTLPFITNNKISVENLLNRIPFKIKMDYCFNNKKSVLHYAVLNNNFNLVNIFLDRKIPITLDSTGRSPIYHAIKNYYWDIVSLFLLKLNWRQMNPDDKELIIYYKKDILIALAKLRKELTVPFKSKLSILEQDLQFFIRRDAKNLMSHNLFSFSKRNNERHIGVKNTNQSNIKFK
jgi:hypothetical protein